VAPAVVLCPTRGRNARRACHLHENIGVSVSGDQPHRICVNPRRAADRPLRACPVRRVRRV
jgi:hypothetical protein